MKFCDAYNIKFILELFILSHHVFKKHRVTSKVKSLRG